MEFDLKLPIGILFSIIGFILTGWGTLTGGDAMYANSLGINVNLLWGGVLLAFGILMLALVRRNKKPGKSNRRTK